VLRHQAVIKILMISLRAPTIGARFVFSLFSDIDI
jgi:hypothetical protein